MNTIRLFLSLLILPAAICCMEEPNKSFGSKMIRTQSEHKPFLRRITSFRKNPVSPVREKDIQINNGTRLSKSASDSLLQTRKRTSAEQTEELCNKTTNPLIAAIKENDLNAVTNILYGSEPIDLNIQQDATGNTVLMIAIEHFKCIEEQQASNELGRKMAKAIVDEIIMKGISSDEKMVAPLDFALKNVLGQTARDLLDPHSPLALKLFGLTKSTR